MQIQKGMKIVSSLQHFKVYREELVTFNNSDIRYRLGYYSGKLLLVLVGVNILSVEASIKCLVRNTFE